MIYESYPWKAELYKSFKTICKFRRLKRVTENSCVKVEIAVMLSAYIIRKLIDAEKIPKEFIEEEIKARKFDINEKIIDHQNWHKIEKNYNLEKYSLVSKPWRYYLNQIVHSFTFIFSYNDDNMLNGFYINSDKSKNKELYFIYIKEYLYLLLIISEGSIVSSEGKRKIISNKEDIKEFGEMIQTKAIYGYQKTFNIDKAITDSMNGNIYKREKFV